MSSATSPTVAHPGQCECRAAHDPRLVVLTGGPGAGKTAVLEMVRRQFCEHVVVLPESASILFGGGFPRRSDPAARRAAQRAIFRVQQELQNLSVDTPRAAVVLCDRGTLDGLAYWPGEPESFFSDLSTTRDREFRNYAAVIHLRTPSLHNGYDHTNPLRVESAREAHAIDQKIAEAWKGHPRYLTVPSAPDFLTKARAALAVIAGEIPKCCFVGSELRRQA